MKVPRITFGKVVVAILAGFSSFLVLGPSFSRLNPEKDYVIVGGGPSSSSVLGEARQPSYPKLLFSDVTQPVYVIYEGTTYTLPYSDVSRFFKQECISSETWCDTIKFGGTCVDFTALSEFLDTEFDSVWNQGATYGIAKNKAGQFKYRLSAYVPNLENAPNDIAKILNLRMRIVCENPERTQPQAGSQDFRQDVVVLSRAVAPGTDGKYTKQYIEIDDSQQHLYVWDNGKVKMDYQMSGAYHNYAVFGVFTIKEKAEMAWSSIAKKWMPHWLAFYWDPKQKAWFGVHELTVWTDKAGEKHYEPESNIGKRLSMGCLRLGRKAAPKVYEFAKLGMPILIHE